MVDNAAVSLIHMALTNKSGNFMMQFLSLDEYVSKLLSLEVGTWDHILACNYSRTSYYVALRGRTQVREQFL